MIETALDKHAIIFSLSPWSLAEIRARRSIFVRDGEKQGGENWGGKGSVSCNETQGGKKTSPPKAGPHIRQRWHAALRGFSVKGTPANFICNTAEEACPLEILVVSFWNQGHLFLGGKRAMFLKARLSIKIYRLPWRPLTTQDCTLCSTLWFSLFKGSALSKTKLVFQLFITKFIMEKVINNKVFQSCVDRCHPWINWGTIPEICYFKVIIAKLAIVRK